MGKRIDFAFTDEHQVSRCKGCGAPIVWVPRPPKVPGQKGTDMPLDLASEQKGLDGVRRAESHFAHCPVVDRFRKHMRP